MLIFFLYLLSEIIVLIIIVAVIVIILVVSPTISHAVSYSLPLPWLSPDNMHVIPVVITIVCLGILIVVLPLVSLYAKVY
jgi:hypothetical protein